MFRLTTTENRFRWNGLGRNRVPVFRDHARSPDAGFAPSGRIIAQTRPGAGTPGKTGLSGGFSPAYSRMPPGCPAASRFGHKVAGGLLLRGLQGLVNVPQNILDGFQAHGNPDHVLADSGFGLLFFVELSVGCR